MKSDNNLNNNSFFSMTGIGVAQAKHAQFSISIEVKSLNHRFKEIKWRLPAMLSKMEVSGRILIEKNFKRGSFDVSIQLRRNEDSFIDHGDSFFNTEKADLFLQQVQKLMERSVVPVTVNAVDFLRSEFANDQQQAELQNLQIRVDELLETALLQLKEYRRQEGVKLIAVLMQFLSELQLYYKKISSLREVAYLTKKDKILKKISEINNSEVDQGRLAQELVYYGERLDIQEELDRFSAHLEKFQENITHARSTELGRELEFILQELGREINTLSNKADHLEISQIAVNCKIVLEKMREQVLNLE